MVFGLQCSLYDLMYPTISLLVPFDLYYVPLVPYCTHTRDPAVLGGAETCKRNQHKQYRRNRVNYFKRASRVGVVKS